MEQKANLDKKSIRRVGNKLMGNYLNIGNDGFSSMVKGNYVDKTELISFMNQTLGTMDKLICVSRPRRFGKSFAAKMLCAYYDKSCDSRKLFSKLKIAKDTSFELHLNKYDVISLDMTLMNVGAGDIKRMVRSIEEKVMDEVNEAYPEVRKADRLIELLANVSEATGNQFIVIIDEWDALFREAKNDTDVQEEYIRWLRSMFKSTLTDKAIAGAYMTGILPIKKYGTQSAMTDFNEYTMLQPEPLEEYTGFTEEEVRILCADSKLKFEELRKWYDGYVLGDNVHIYSPKSGMDAIRRRRIGNYWTQSETYESLKLYIEMDENGLKEAIVQMLGGAQIKIDPDTFQNDMTTIRCRDDVLTLLVHLGYLSYDVDKEKVSIPNEEVRREFVRALTSGKHKEVAKLIRNSDKLLEETINMN
ncbi:MAG: AAA family ATPase, partial [Lachnospiraceae bacterium]|nr:AAA family ATPase [Lachnospiraceae bacterium]